MFEQNTAFIPWPDRRAASPRSARGYLERKVADPRCGRKLTPGLSRSGASAS